MKVTVLSFVLSMAVGGLIGCQPHDPGPFEKAGTRAEEIKDNIEEGKNPLHKKTPLEKAGESVDKTLGTDK